jgi:hypothetical protein
VTSVVRRRWFEKTANSPNTSPGARMSTIRIAHEGVDARIANIPLSNEVKRVPGIACVKDDVPLIERSLVGDDVAGVHGRQDTLEQVLAARVWWSPSFGLGRK